MEKKKRFYKYKEKQDNGLEMDGEIVQDLGFGNYAVSVDGMGNIIAYLGGKMKMHKILVMVGDKVKVRINPDDRSKGIIIFRAK